ncbi:MAG: right-handed parallel beta-helix repeat-containing protein [Planctomycetes bacterium]|nr:right-handed parallel beta-helix repeat-containing protein [Planctomycetota bacterium]MCB9885319.1 right-handed parallel beta-helix repeat-containing protein [Planctomycetota bacterium]
MKLQLSLHLGTLLGIAAALPAQLSGTYAIGVGGNFPDIAAAVTALNGTGVTGPVTFLVTANDTSGPWTINSFAGQGAANPVLFDALGPITIGGAQTLLTLNGCASVTFRGFNGTFAATPSPFVINAGTTDCVFTGCDFHATVATSGQALFNLIGGSNCRFEDMSFGGGYEALYAQAGNDGTTVERCRITGGGFWTMRMDGTNFTLVNNFISGTSNYGLRAGTSCTNLKIWHNSVYSFHPANAGSQFCTLRWYSTAAGTEVVNNIFYDDYPSATGNNMWCSGTARPALMDYNCLWSNATTYVPVWASAAQTFASWQGLGFDVNSIAADPQFVAPGATPADLTLQPSSPCAQAGTFLIPVLTDFFQAPRTPPVSIGAHEEDGMTASYSTIGAGCPGSVGIATNTASAPPRLGQTATISFGNLPAPYFAFAILGLSNTVSAFGPLPVDLSAYGAPGCFGRVSTDVSIFIVGAAGTASMQASTPNQPYLIGLTYFTQALVFDAVNPLGAVMSDAAAAVVGL